MIPLTPAYAISIHKSQGMTLDKVILNIGKSEFANGLTYTGLSRVKKIEDLAFDDPFPAHERFLSIQKPKQFVYRREEDLRLQLLQRATLNDIPFQDEKDSSLCAILWTDI